MKKHWFAILPVGATLLLAALWPLAATATTTGASATASGAGVTVQQSFVGGAQGTQASAAQTFPTPYGDAYLSAEAASLPGALRAAGASRSGGAPGDFQARASASWADSFVIAAPGRSSSETGFFSGSVEVTGELLVAYAGRTYADALVFGSIDIFPGTGYNGGRTVVNGAARNTVGYDIPGGHTGSDRFVLVFSNVPFTFNQRIDVSLGLSVTADVHAVDPGATGRSDANYAHTMTWAGLSQVRDQAGTPLTVYSALSADSGFNFAQPTPLPEASSMVLTALGCVWLAGLARMRRRGHPT